MIKSIFFLVESFNIETLNKEIISQNPDSIIINYNPQSLKHYIFYSPPYWHIKKKICSVIKFNQYYLNIIGFLIYSLSLFLLALKLTFKFRPKVFIAEGYYLGFQTGILRCMRIYKRSVYISGDWFVGNKRKSKILGLITNELIFPMMDFCACKLNDVTFNITELIGNKRQQYWSKRIAKIEKTIYFPLTIKSRNIDKNKINKQICFVGIMREQCGLDVAIRSLKELRNYADFSISIIGPYSYDYKIFKKIAEDTCVARYVHFLGFLDRNKFKDILSSCFCGLHLLNIKESYNSFSFPAKIGDYIQYLLPIIATEDIGCSKELIMKNNLGVIINLDEKTFISNLLSVYKEQNVYRANIIKYLEHYRATPIYEILGEK